MTTPSARSAHSRAGSAGARGRWSSRASMSRERLSAMTGRLYVGDIAEEEEEEEDGDDDEEEETPFQDRAVGESIRPHSFKR